MIEECSPASIQGWAQHTPDSAMSAAKRTALSGPGCCEGSHCKPRGNPTCIYIVEDSTETDHKGKGEKGKEMHVKEHLQLNESLIFPSHLSTLSNHLHLRPQTLISKDCYTPCITRQAFFFLLLHLC